MLQPERMERFALKRLSLVIGGGLGVFSVLMAAAMAAYPGGSWLQRSSRGHAFWGNYWCDLLRNPGLNGEDNAVSAGLAQWAMLAMAMTLLIYWFVASSLFLDRAALARWTRGLGSLGAIGLALITQLPSDRFAGLHVLAVVLAGPMGIAATALAIVGLASAPGTSRLARFLGIALAVSASATLLQYTRQAWLGAAESALLPALQKVATGLLMLWMVVISWQARRAG